MRLQGIHNAETLTGQQSCFIVHDQRYYPSQWRRDTQGCAGGMIMESSVHFIAALRMLAAAVGLGEAVQATARTYHAKPDLSAPDTLVGTVSFEHGTAPASVSITLAATQVRPMASALSGAGCRDGRWSLSSAALCR